MKLKIKIEFPDDRDYRSSAFPYDIQVDTLASDIQKAVRDALVDLNCSPAIRKLMRSVEDNGHYVGEIKIKLAE